MILMIMKLPTREISVICSNNYNGKHSKNGNSIDENDDQNQIFNKKSRHDRFFTPIKKKSP